MIVSGPEGRLEGRYHHGNRPDAPIALILHPHPQHGGTMNNKLVYALYQTFARRGFSVLRFNFRGVGRSEGRFDNGHGELSDAASAFDWIQSYNPNPCDCWISGYSFGAWIAMQVLMRRPEINGFIAIAPPVNMFDFAFLAPCPSSGLILHGSADEIVPEPAVAELAKRLGSQRHITVDYRVIDGANHNFANRLDALNAQVDTYLGRRVRETPGR